MEYGEVGLVGNMFMRFRSVKGVDELGRKFGEKGFLAKDFLTSKLPPCEATRIMYMLISYVGKRLLEELTR